MQTDKPGHEFLNWSNGQVKIMRYFIGQPLGEAWLWSYYKHRREKHLGITTVSSQTHRPDGPAIITYDQLGYLTHQEYWVYGWRIYIGMYLMMISKAKDKDKKFVEIIEKFNKPGERYRVGILLINLCREKLSEKLVNSTLAALTLTSPYYL